METSLELKQLKKAALDELRNDILPFWMNNMRDGRHGFYGRIDGNGLLHKDSPRGSILNSRILWTFSSAYRIFCRQEYLEVAKDAERILIEHFYDKEFGGVYWSIDSCSNPLDCKKQIYAIAFAIYGLAEFYRATADEEALEYAVRLYRDIEEYSFDIALNGYKEAFAREWDNLEDVRLSEKDDNANKTMNTHLHLLEAYTCLYRSWKDEGLEKQLRNLIHLFTDVITDRQNGHLKLFFDDNWKCTSSIVSYGHDIEASWLLDEAVSVLGDSALEKECSSAVMKLAESSCEGLLDDGSMIYEYSPDKGYRDEDRHWWVQAESVVGYLNIFERTGKEEWLDKAVSCMEFISSRLVDPENGEWFWSILSNGTINRKDDKAGFWKCPYHNSRMCFEIIERYQILLCQTALPKCISSSRKE